MSISSRFRATGMIFPSLRPPIVYPEVDFRSGYMPSPSLIQGINSAVTRQMRSGLLSGSGSEFSGFLPNNSRFSRLHIFFESIPQWRGCQDIPHELVCQPAPFTIAAHILNNAVRKGGYPKVSRIFAPISLQSPTERELSRLR